MSLRLASRRGAAAAVVAAELPGGNSVSVADIRVRKWTKQLKTVGHLTILKWVPDQENPTLALQKGAPKKTKGGRKRVQTGEMGRMTRSVRQHLDAPLELLNEIPMHRNNPVKQQAAPATAAVPTATLLEASTDPTANAQAASGVSVKSEQSDIAGSTPTAATTAAPGILPGSQGSDPLLASAVQSDEQLEMALDDLPMLDSDEDLPFDSLLEDQVPPAVPVAAAKGATATATITPSAPDASAPEAEQQPATTAEAAPELSPAPTAESAENTAESAAEGDDDDGSNSSSASDDDDDNGSAVSGSPMPSPSPQTSPMLSRSPSP